MTNGQSLTHDDVNTAFNSGSVFRDPDDRLFDYLGILCSTRIESDPVRLLANNRCITINTILTRRFIERENRATTKLTWLVILLAVLSLVGTIVQICLATRGG